MTETGERTALLDLLRTGRRGVLVTLKRDGRPQISNVGYLYDDTGAIVISSTDDRAKVRNLRRDPRASFHVTSGDFYQYVVAEGTATLTAVTTDPHDPVADQLVAHYRAIRGEHPDWDEFRAAMVGERRLLVRLPVDREYGWIG